MKILIASSSHLGVELLEHLRKSEHEVLGAISSPDRASGRGRSKSSNEFATYCQGLGIILHKPRNDQELSAALKESNTELVITLAYGRLVRGNELEIPKYGWLNVHFSLLPRWRGASPIQSAIAAGDSSTGITVFKLDKGMDTGPIYSTLVYELTERSRSGQVLDQLASLAIEPVLKALEMIESGQSPKAQSSNGITLAPKILKGEGKIDWNRDSRQIDRQIRALHPWPGTYSRVNDTRVAIIEAKPIDASGFAGEILSLEPLIVATGSGALEISRVKPENKKEMSSVEWLRGARISLPCAFE